MDDQVSLRERKKLRTRQMILQAARRLFAERGFDDVTVAEIAEAAEVAEGTVFNYFEVKEDLFFAGMEAFEAELVEAVSTRPAEVSVLEAVRAFLAVRAKQRDTDGLAENAALGARLIADSKSLQRRQLEMMDRHTKELARRIAGEAGVAGDPIESFVVANALMGVHRALVELVQSLALDGASGAHVSKAVADAAERSFSLLAGGLGDWGRRR